MTAADPGCSASTADATLAASARPARLTGVRPQLGALAVLSTAVTVSFAVVPSLRFGYRAPAVHVALETAASLVAFLAAFLVLGRLLREQRRSDLVLACGLAVLAFSNFWFRTVPALANARSEPSFVWAAVDGRLLGALLLAAAAVASPGRLRNPRRAAVAGVAGALMVVVAGAVVALLLRHYHELPRLPSPPVSRAPSAEYPYLHVPAVFPAAQAVAAVLYAVALVGFARRALRRNDDFLRWLALGCVLSVFSRVNYFLYPSSYTNWVYLGDAFRLGFFTLLLVAGLREIAGYWRVAAGAAALDERRRLARDLHDGLAQEVAFLRSSLPALEDGGDPDLASRLAAAAERAERESRQLLAALRAPSGETFDVVLAEVVSEVAAREGIAVDLDLASGVRLDRVRSEGLLRIAAEAVTNAARHSGEKEVRVLLEQLGDRVRLCVSDDGIGFATDTAPEPPKSGHGFGLTSMHGRAAAIGAELSLISQPRAGTRVEVVA